MPSTEEAVALKQKGNEAFAKHDWLAAVDLYTQAIEANNQDPSFYCNRAQACALQLNIEGIWLTRDPGEYKT